MDGVGQPLREDLGHVRHGRPHLLAQIDGVRARQGVDEDLRGLVPAHPGKVAVHLLAEFDPGDVLDPDDLRRLAILGWHGLDDDILELRDLVQPAQGVDGKLEGLIVRHGRAAELTGHHLIVLLLDGIGHVHRGHAVVLEPFRIHPDAHAVGPRSQHLDLADARNPAQRVLQVDQRIVGEIGFVVTLILGVQTDCHQDVGRNLSHADSLLLHRIG